MMKSKFIVFCLMIVILIGCDNVSYTYEASVDYEAPNWTSDGKVVFIKDSNYVKIAHGAMGSEQWNVEGSKEVLTLCEINSDGTGFTEKGVVLRSEDYAYALGVTGLSSAGSWVIFGIEGLHIYIASRNVTGSEEVGEGSYPDFSPDASQIVYEKPNQGIWIMDRDGGNDRQIISDADARYPAWSEDGGRIAFKSDSTYVADTTGTKIRGFFRNLIDLPDWGPLDSNSICGSNGYFIVIINCESGEVDTLDITSTLGWGQGVKWSSNGGFFISADAGGWFTINENGTNKWYLQP